MQHMTRPRLGFALVLVVLGASAALAAASAYPTFECAARKQRAAADRCQRTFTAWATWERTGNTAVRDAAIDQAQAMLERSFARADRRAAHEGLDCAEATHPASAVGSFIDAAVSDIADGIGSPSGHGPPCDQVSLVQAGVACRLLLGATSKATGSVGSPMSKPLQAQREARARGRLTAAAHGPCADQTHAVADAVQNLVDGVVFRTSVSSAVPSDTFETITPDGPIEYEGRSFTAQCMDGSPYAYFVKRGTVNKVLYYFQGGGACWEQLTCSVPTCDPSVTPGDNPANSHSGFADISNPANPFRDWNIVFVSYCSCDIHYGDTAQDYANVNPASPLHVEHRGFENAKVVEKFAREHFLNPDVVFVTGSSAGAYGAWFNAPNLELAWPGSQFHVLADAGNGVVTAEFRSAFFPNWGFDKNVPPEFPTLRALFDGQAGVPEYTEAVTKLFPDTTWSHYATAFDGGSGGQTGFYNIMLNDNDPIAALSWWNGSCAFNAVMRDQAMETYDAVSAGPDNYRYYIGTGSRHTMWGSDKVYGDTTGGVPPIVDWVNAQLASGNGTNDPAWTNVECTNCGLLLPGDPRPNPLVPPFTQQGPDVVVQCVASPSGAFLDGGPTG
jgi:hypothetical protein